MQYVSVLRLPYPHDSTEPRRLAVFQVDGDTVTPTYFDEAFERDVKQGLVFSAKADRHLQPEDGAEFIDGLKAEFQQSSTIDVVEADAPPMGDELKSGKRHPEAP